MKPKIDDLRLIAEATLRKTGDVGLRHAKQNLPFIERTISDLASLAPVRLASDSAVVISAGPSLHRRESLNTIRTAGYAGTLVTVDGALGHCLRNGIVPEYVVTVDPHPTRIIRWFGDPHFESRPDDDYFRRQDLDPALNRAERARNAELLELVNRYGPKIKAIISTSVSPDITRRCLEAGMDLYWWNPLYDDYDQPNSYTRRVYELTKVTCMVSGGNCGTSAWVFAHAVLGFRTVALVGMDFGYPPGTPLIRTQYYTEIQELYGDRASEAYRYIHNPDLGETWFVDPAYYWYRESFLELAQVAECTTYNCTEGGTLFGDGVTFCALQEFLKRFSDQA